MINNTNNFLTNNGEKCLTIADGFNPSTKLPYDLKITYCELADRITITVPEHLSIRQIFNFRLALLGSDTGEKLADSMGAIALAFLREKDWKPVLLEMATRGGRILSIEIAAQSVQIIIDYAFSEEHLANDGKIVGEAMFYESLSDEKLAILWDQANNIFEMWQNLEDTIDAESLIDWSQYRTPKETIQQASKFGLWIEEHQEQLFQVEDETLLLAEGILEAFLSNFREHCKVPQYT